MFDNELGPELETGNSKNIPTKYTHVLMHAVICA